jgi:Na+-translocating ferredoxin:NAD+ oxidoreductase RnfC subunit
VLGDFYPSGDEYELVYAATGRLIPPAGIPLQVSCVVSNVETLYNVERARRGIPVTEKLVSVCGAVRKPKTFWAPVGTSFRELLAAAGGAEPAEFGIFVSGIMMGKLSFDLDDVVTKTTAGLIILPREHTLVTRTERPMEAKARIGKSACDQCSYCTEFCPRYLLGYEVQPHKVMRSLGFTLTGSQNWNQWAELCCGCGLCTLYACPEDLFPKEACDQGKADRRAAGLKFTQEHPAKAHPMKEYRRVPQSQLRMRLRIDEYDVEAPFEKVDLRPSTVRIRMRQHAGKPAVPTVAAGARVKKGQLIGAVDESQLGAGVHASISGVVKAASADCVEISA